MLRIEVRQAPLLDSESQEGPTKRHSLTESTRLNVGHPSGMEALTATAQVYLQEPMPGQRAASQPESSLSLQSVHGMALSLRLTQCSYNDILIRHA